LVGQARVLQPVVVAGAAGGGVAQVEPLCFHVEASHLQATRGGVHRQHDGSDE